MKLTAQSNRILKVYRLLPDAEREKLARVRRLSPKLIVQHPYFRPTAKGRKRTNPAELQELIDRIGPKVREQPATLRETVLRRTRVATYRGSDPGPYAETPPSPVNLAADLEAQATVWAIELRDRNLLDPGDFEAMTRAWREVGLPL